MLFKVNPTKQNIQTEQGALVVTGNCYVQLHTPLTDMRRFKVLIKQKGGKKKRGGKSKQKHEWSLCERPVIKLLGTSLHQKRHTHSHANAWCIHTLTLTSSDYWAVAATPLIEHVSVSEEKHNICRPRQLLGRGREKKTQQGIILATCVLADDLFTTLPGPPTHIRPPTIMLVTILKSTAHFQFQLYFDALCGSVYLMSCAKNSLFFFLTIHIHGLLNKTSLVPHMPVTVVKTQSKDSCCRLSVGKVKALWPQTGLIKGHISFSHLFQFESFVGIDILNLMNSEALANI